jgi:transposase
MPMTALRDPKCDVLCAHASLNRHPERVTDALFVSQPFFDPRDLLQVRYEMLRRVLVEGQPVGSTAAAFGYSRMTLHQLRKRFEAQGLAALLPQHKGPQRNRKLTKEVMAFVRQALDTEPALRIADLPKRVSKQFGLTVHLRSIERALARERKKD